MDLTFAYVFIYLSMHACLCVLETFDNKKGPQLGSAFKFIGVLLYMASAIENIVTIEMFFLFFF